MLCGGSVVYGSGFLQPPRFIADFDKFKLAILRGFGKEQVEIFRGFLEYALRLKEIFTFVFWCD